MIAYALRLRPCRPRRPLRSRSRRSGSPGRRPPRHAPRCPRPARWPGTRPRCPARPGCPAVGALRAVRRGRARLGHRRGGRRRTGRSRGRRLGRDRLGDELDQRHRGVVALARTDLGDPGVATRAVLEGRGDLGEQNVHHTLVPNGLEHLATGVDVAPLGLGDQLLRHRTQPLGLGLGGHDLAVLEQLAGQIRQDDPLVGGAAAQACALGRCGISVLRFLLHDQLVYRSQVARAERAPARAASTVSTARSR